MMVSGNAANMPSIFQSVRFLTTAVASEMSYASGLQRQALFSMALVLFLFIMLINATLNFFLKRSKEDCVMSTKRSAYVGIMRFLMWLCTGITAALVLFLLVYVLMPGFPNISW